MSSFVSCKSRIEVNRGQGQPFNPHRLTLVGALCFLLGSPLAGMAQDGRRLLLEDTPPLNEETLLQERGAAPAAEQTLSNPLEKTDAEEPLDDLGPGCAVPVASPAVGAEIEEAYFGPEPSTVNPSLVGSVQLLTAGELDPEARTITLPLYQGVMAETGENVWYIVTDTTDIGNATGLELNFAAKLVYADTGRGVRTANLTNDGVLVFDQGTMDFSPERTVIPESEAMPFPPQVAEPSSVGDENYSPLVKVVNAGGHIYNAPIIAFGVDAEDIDFPDGDPDYSLVHDSVVAIDIEEETVTLDLTLGFSFARSVLYLSIDASEMLPAALEGATFAPELQDVETGNDDSLFSAVERIFIFTNGPRDCENPQRQGLEAAILDGNTPFNVLGGIPTLALDYSPLWDQNIGEWTTEAIDNGYRSRLTEEFQILHFVENGFVTGPGGEPYGSVGAIVNCPIAFRFL